MFITTWLNCENRLDSMALNKCKKLINLPSKAWTKQLEGFDCFAIHGGIK